MSSKKHLHDNLKNVLHTPKTRLFFISSEIADLIAEARIFFLILLICYSFYIIPPCPNIIFMFEINEAVLVL